MLRGCNKIGQPTVDDPLRCLVEDKCQRGRPYVTKGKAFNRHLLQRNNPGNLPLGIHGDRNEA